MLQLKQHWLNSITTNACGICDRLQITNVIHTTNGCLIFICNACVSINNEVYRCPIKNKRMYKDDTYSVDLDVHNVMALISRIQS